MTVTELRLNYEYIISDNQSVMLIAGGMIPHKIPELIYDPESVEKEYGGDADLNNKLTNFIIGIQYRFYTGQSSTAPQGFYFAPMIKYHHYGITTDALYEDNITESQYQDLTDEEKTHASYISKNNYNFKSTGTFDGSLNRIGAGIAIGYQWLISDSFTIDWTIIGINVEKLTGELQVTSNSPSYTPDFQQWGDDIQEGANDFLFIGEKVEAVVESDMVKVSLPITLPMPYTSLTLGYYF